LDAHYRFDLAPIGFVEVQVKYGTSASA